MINVTANTLQDLDCHQEGVISPLENSAYALFDQFRDIVIEVDVRRSEVIWCSLEFSAQFPAVIKGEGLSELTVNFVGLEKYLGEFESGLLELQGVKQENIFDNEGNYYSVQMIKSRSSNIILRFEKNKEHERVIQRHLEDREKLLFTSRAISVSEMATTLAHELNQPIGTISNLLRGVNLRLRRGDGATEEILDALDGAVDQALFSSKIISRVRTYTQSIQPQHLSVDLGELAKASISLLDWEMRREGIEISYKNSANSPLMVKGDEIMLQQVFVNLIRNAIDAMRENSKANKFIKVGAERSGTQVEISIADSGCGLSIEAENNLFVPFVSTKPSGMGVGLNICRSFIEMHQGKLWMSKNEDKGCTFYVSLPAMSEN